MNEFLMRVALLSLSFEKEISIYAKESSAYKIKCIWRLLVCAWKGRAGAAMAGGITRGIILAAAQRKVNRQYSSLYNTQTALKMKTP
jgi:hypothetical protein